MGLEQDWINSGFGQQVDTPINSWFNLVDPTNGACGLICDGADGQGGGLIFGDAGTAAQPMSQNLLVNPGFEMADPSGSGYSGVTIPGWTETGTPTVIAYGTPRAVIRRHSRLRSQSCRSSSTFHRTRPWAAATISPAADPWPRPPSAKPSTSPAQPERRSR